VVEEAGSDKKKRWVRRHPVLVTVCIVMVAIVAYRAATAWTNQRDTCAYRSGEDLPAQLIRIARPAASEIESDITIMTYNIQGQAAFFRPNHLEEVARVIRESGADLVSLQEVHAATWQSRGRHQAEELGRMTRMSVLFGPSFGSADVAYGNAILTRGTVVSARVLDLPNLGEPRSLLLAGIDLDGRRFDFASTHLASWGRLNAGDRPRQVQCIVSTLGAHERPLVVAGDFNAPPGAPEMQFLFSGGFIPASSELRTPSHRYMKNRIDYILMDQRWEVMIGGVLRDGPSDHWPILATMRLREPLEDLP
jgi:endonuclease/exonuclease/phosphatase family metal-dependent hydrolase